MYHSLHLYVSKHNIYIKFIPFQRHPTDKAYFIAKEILMTERTYKKDLEVINLVGGGSPNLIKQFTWYLLLIKDKDRSVKKILSPMKNFEVINLATKPAHRIFMDFIKPSHKNFLKIRWDPSENMWKSKMTESWLKFKKLRQ